MEQVVIVGALRTAMGRSKGGVFRHVRAEDLSAEVMKALVKNAKCDPTQIDDVIWGCVQQTLEQGFNLARNAALCAGIPHSVSAQTVNRLCGSSMTALHIAYANIKAGLGDVFLVGGVEHMGHVPMTHGYDQNPKASRYFSKGSGSMGMTAELLGRMHHISRQEQDAFALRSHQKAHEATQKKYFESQILPIMGHTPEGAMVSVATDEVIRPDTSLEALAGLKPSFDPIHGTVTAGNASAISDGASGLLVVSESFAKKFNLQPLARVMGVAASGCEPAIMGYGPVTAVRKMLKPLGHKPTDFDLIELNEAFAAQSLPVIRDLGLSEYLDDRINVTGGAIALGHPLGCSGSRIIATLLYNMKRLNKKKGLATMCIGMGQGVASAFELC